MEYKKENEYATKNALHDLTECFNNELGKNGMTEDNVLQYIFHRFNHNVKDISNKLVARHGLSKLVANQLLSKTIRLDEKTNIIFKNNKTKHLLYDFNKNDIPLDNAVKQYIKPAKPFKPEIMALLKEDFPIMIQAIRDYGLDTASRLPKSMIYPNFTKLSLLLHTNKLITDLKSSIEKSNGFHLIKYESQVNVSTLSLDCHVELSIDNQDNKIYLNVNNQNLNIRPNKKFYHEHGLNRQLIALTVLHNQLQKNTSDSDTLNQLNNIGKSLEQIKSDFQIAQYNHQYGELNPEFSHLFEPLGSKQTKKALKDKEDGVKTKPKRLVM